MTDTNADIAAVIAAATFDAAQAVAYRDDLIRAAWRRTLTTAQLAAATDMTIGDIKHIIYG